jgi:hypothetical protein
MSPYHEVCGFTERVLIRGLPALPAKFARPTPGLSADAVVQQGKMPTMMYARVLVLILPLALAQHLTCDRALGEPVDFNESIKPILSDRCFHCHGPDAEDRQAGLRLDQRATATAETQSGVATHLIVPGKPDDSEVVLRVESDEDGYRMPPEDSGLSLTKEERALIRRWIEEGANWSEHWAFQSLRPIEVPEQPTSGWARNEIDRFVWQRMQTNGLKPAPEADRRTLIRRLYFDLTGLPPEPADVERFVNDTRSDAYERLVDQVLQSTRYGERMASEWMDVARYSDTYGYQVDRDRFVWPWRDWVVNAFNANLPYDEFIRLQLAGDLLPNATDQQILATTFSRLHSQKVEGGSVPEEFRVEYVADRTQTVATAFLGLTLECARCHDHKYDPLSQREYFQLTAFFDNIDEAGLYSYFTPAIPTPTLLLHDDASRAKVAAIEQQIKELEQRQVTLAAEQPAAFDEWLRDKRSSLVGESNEEKGTPNADELRMPGRLAHIDFEQIGDTANQQVEGVSGKAIRLTGDDAFPLSVGNFSRSDPFTVALWMKTPDVKSRAVVFHRSRAWTDAASRGYELLIEDGRLSAALIHFWPGNAIRVQCRKPLPIDRWTHVAIRYDGSSRAAGLNIFVDGIRAETDVVRDHLYKNITGGGSDHITIGERFRDRGFTKGCVDEFQVFSRQLSTLEIAELAGQPSLQTLLAASVEDLNAVQLSQLREYYFAAHHLAQSDLESQLSQLRKQLDEVLDQVPEIMVMREMSERRPTHVLNRGAYDAPGDAVAPDTPAVLPAFPADLPRNRLGLANWLVDPDHPLTARVTVNRYWQMVFGEGLVRTPEDFGSQGRPPTHPLLLSWLANDFTSNGWDVKRLLRMLVMSATYRQSSEASSDALQKDPENLWLARAFRFRLPAEMLRDNALFVSDLMDQTIGGPPALPYELQESFKPVEAGKGHDIYRRSVYTYWKRTAPAPVMMAFDSSSREVCRVKRERTSSPIQALVLLNDPQMVEASRAMAVRILRSYPPEDGQANSNEEALRMMFRWLTSRSPLPVELSALESLVRDQHEYFAANHQERDAYLTVGRHRVPEDMDLSLVAAYATVANTLFSFDGCAIRR